MPRARWPSPQVGRGSRPRKPLRKEHPILELIRNRCTMERFDTERGLEEDEIRALVHDATRAPSSFNIQHWRFVAVRRREDKERLKEAAHGQTQVTEAAVTFLVLGDVGALEKLPAILDRAVADGALPQRKAEAWLRMAREIYADASMARDEALRSAALAAMTLMLAAEARGLGSAALSGFDVARVRREFAIEERYLPVLLVSVGHPAAIAPTRQRRLDVDEVLARDRGRRF